MSRSQALRISSAIVGRRGALGPAGRAVEVGGEVAVTEVEPRRGGRRARRAHRLVAGDGLHGVPGLAGQAPAPVSVDGARQRVRDRVEVGGDRQPMEHGVITGVDDGGDPLRRHDELQTAQEARRTDSSADHRHVAVHRPHQHSRPRHETLRDSSSNTRRYTSTMASAVAATRDPGTFSRPAATRRSLCCFLVSEPPPQGKGEGVLVAERDELGAVAGDLGDRAGAGGHHGQPDRLARATSRGRSRPTSRVEASSSSNDA